MFPDEKNYFFDDVTKLPLISIRPNQFIIFSKNTKVKGKVFCGEINSQAI